MEGRKTNGVAPVPAKNMQVAAAILSRIRTAPWFSRVGSKDFGEECHAAVRSYLSACGFDSGRVRWGASWEETCAVLRAMDDAAALWPVEEGVRQQAARAAGSAGRAEMLDSLLNQLSEAGYEWVRPAFAEEELARVASGALLWTAASAVTYALAEDLLEETKNLFLPKLRVFEGGHWPLGIHAGIFLVV